MRIPALVIAASCFLAACSSSSAGSSGSGSGTVTGSSGSGTASTGSGSGSGTTGIQPGQPCTSENLTECSDFHHQAWCHDGAWTLRNCSGPQGCSAQGCDRHDVQPGSSCDALDTSSACDFNYTQLHCDLDAGVWETTCYCGVTCNDATGTCPSGCFNASGSSTSSTSTSSTSSTSTGSSSGSSSGSGSGSTSGSGSSSGSSSSSSGSSSSSSGSSSSSSGSSSGSSGSSSGSSGPSSGSSGSSGSTGGLITDGGHGGTLDLNPVGFHSTAAFGMYQHAPDGGLDSTFVYILAFDSVISCNEAQGDPDAGSHYVYATIHGIQPITAGSYAVSWLGPAVVSYIFPVDGGNDVSTGNSGTVNLTAVGVDSGFAGTIQMSAAPLDGTPNPSPDAGYFGSFDVPYCQLF